MISAIQAKLTVGPADDRYEQEADRVAAQVVAAPSPVAPIAQREVEDEELQAKPLVSTITPLVQRETTLEEEEIQTKALVQRSGDGFEAGADFEERLSAARGGGEPLPDATRELMETRIGADFGGVKVHADAQSDQLNQAIQAKAFTTGQDVFFREGAYQPGSAGGLELIAHELTHVVQQTGGKAAATTQPAIQRKVLDADIILSGVPTVLAGNALLPRGGELTLDTILFKDKTLKERIEDIITTYETQFQKAESPTAVSHNAQKVLAAFQTIGMVIARKLHMGQEGHKSRKRYWPVSRIG